MAEMSSTASKGGKFGGACRFMGASSPTGAKAGARNGSDPQEVEVYAGVAELLASASKNDVYEMSRLLDTHKKEGLTADSTDPMKRTALHEAARAGAAVAVKFCLTRGAFASPLDAWEKTPLDDAIENGDQETQSILVKAGARVGSVKEMATKLFGAIATSNLDLVKSLIDSGCPVNSKDDENRTALHYAAAKGDLAIIKHLVNAGAKLDIIDNFGLTPLGEAARHKSRTGENKVKDYLVAAGADTMASGEATKQTRNFVVLISALQLLFIVLFATCSRYSPSTTDAKASPDALRTTYSMFMDVHVMIFIGFGYLMTFLRKYGHSSVGINFLIGAFIIQWHMLCGGFFEQLFQSEGHFHKIELTLQSLLLGDFAAAVVLITFGALLGKVSPLQILILGFLEIICFSLNEQILLKIGILDVGGSIIVHLFGAYFGLAASWWLSPKSASSNENNASVYHSDLFAMIGTVFLWIYWPSFVASPAGPRDQQRAIIATTLSLTGSCVSAYVSSLWLRKGRFSMVDVQNATLAGGVAIGSAANLTVLSPAEALSIGVIGGILSVVGYALIQPGLEKLLGLHDTCGVHNLHGMPAVFAGIASAIVIGYSGDAETWQRYSVDGAASMHANTSSFHDVYKDLAGRGRSQAGYQIACVAVSLAIAVVGGLLCAMLVRLLGSPEDENLFLDRGNFEVPHFEVPFYFDRRGEINRDTVSFLVEEEASKHGGQRMPLMFREAGPSPPSAPLEEAMSSRPAAASGHVSNDLLNLKIDLLLQNVLTSNSGAREAAIRSAPELPFPIAQESANNSTYQPILADGAGVGGGAPTP